MSELDGGRYITTAEMHLILWNFGIKISHTRAYQLIREWNLPHIRVGGGKKRCGKIFVDRQALLEKLHELEKLRETAYDD